MSAVKSSPAYTSAVDGTNAFVVHTPMWVTVVRGFQAFFCFIILILAGLLIHGLALDAVVFGLVCGLFTFIVVGYALITEKAAGCQRAYNIWAILSLDLLMVIFWLSSMGANAALRASFIYDVNADCYDDGSAINAGHCIVSKRGHSMGKRYPVASHAGLAEMSAVAGLSALEMLLFIATLVYNGHAFRMYHQEKKERGDNGDVELKSQNNQQQNVPRSDSQQFPQYINQQQYTSQAYGELPTQPHSQTIYDSAYSSQPQYPQAQPEHQGSTEMQGSLGEQQQQTYNHHSTPVQYEMPYHSPGQ